MDGASPAAGDTRAAERPPEQPSSAASAAGYRLFDRQRSVRQIAGDGRVADIILWRTKRVTFGMMISATLAWLLFERSGLSFLTICSDVLLILIVIQFMRVKAASIIKKQLKPLPQLVLSEEMVNNAAAMFRVKVNNMLMMAHDITLGKDFRLFFQVVVLLWLLSVVGVFFSSFTTVYAGFIALLILPALYNKYEKHVDKYAGIVQRTISEHYKIVDDNVISQIPRHFIKEKAK